jgi:hypothetical protein
MVDISNTQRIGDVNTSLDVRGAEWLKRVTVCIVAALLVSFAAASGKADPFPTDVNSNNGPIMQNAKAFLIYWQPWAGGYSFTSQGTSGDQFFMSTIKQFFNDLLKTEYFSLAVQYVSLCNGIDVPLYCRSSLSFGDSLVDLAKFSESPLGEIDILDSIGRALVAKSSWPKGGLSALFFVFLPKGINYCDPMGNCSGKDFCAEHAATTVHNNTFIYAVMPQVQSLGSGCGMYTSSELGVDRSLSIDQPPFPSFIPNQLEADWEIVGVSHELFEAITDPLLNGWTNPSEIGDPCASMIGGLGNTILNDVGGNVFLHSHQYFVQEIWSNAHHACVLGASVILAIETGGDDLRGNSLLGCGGSKATLALFSQGTPWVEDAVLKREGDPGWGNYSWHNRVSSFPADHFILDSLAVSLVQGTDGCYTNSDSWNINTLSFEVLDRTGALLCEGRFSGNPLAILSKSNPTLTLQTNCRPVALPVPPLPPGGP